MLLVSTARDDFYYNVNRCRSVGLPHPYGEWPGLQDFSLVEEEKTVRSNVQPLMRHLAARERPAPCAMLSSTKRPLQ